MTERTERELTPCYVVMDGNDKAYAVSVNKPEYDNTDFLTEHAGSEIQAVPLWKAQELLKNWQNAQPQ